MEDSEKRKEMLKAMRMEAAGAAAQNDNSTTMMNNTSHLSNPLAETEYDEAYEKPRFDYYTDPMSAYSSFKRNKISSPPSHQINSSPVPQFPPSVPGSEYQGHDGFQAPCYDGDNLHTQPRGMSHLSPSHRGPPGGWNNNFMPLPPPPPFNHLGPTPPQWVPRPYPVYQETPNMGNNSYGGRGSYNNNAPQYPNYGRQNSNWNGNAYPGSGRGRSRGRGFGRDGGGGRRPMEVGAERFYSNTMVEDPWKYLKPVLWKRCSDASTSNSTSQSWLPNSIAAKKPIMVSEAPNKPKNNQQSLAEYLAASLDEATSDEPSN